MPLANEHAARLKDPKKYSEWARKNNAFGSGIHAIYGIITKPKQKSELQSIHFNSSIWTVKAAKKWLKDHNHKWILFEPATGKKNKNSLSDIPLEALRFNSNSEINISGSDEDNGPPKFHMIVNSGIPFRHFWWGTLGINMKGVKLNKKTLPILREHRDVAGYSEKVDISIERGVEAFGLLSQSTATGREIYDLSQEGFPWEASGYFVPLKIIQVEKGAEAEVNGHKFSGPGAIFEESELREASFCVLGADANTSAEAFNIENLNERSGEAMEDVNVDITSIEELKAAYPDLCKLMDQESEKAVKAAVDKAVAEERDRTVQILKSAFDDQGKMALEAIEQGTELKDALIKFNVSQREKLAELKGKDTTTDQNPDGPSMFAQVPSDGAGDKAPKDKKPDPNDPEALAEADFEQHKAYYKQIGTELKDLVAFYKGKAEGRVRELADETPSLIGHS